MDMNMYMYTHTDTLMHMHAHMHMYMYMYMYYSHGSEKQEEVASKVEGICWRTEYCVRQPKKSSQAEIVHGCIPIQPKFSSLLWYKCLEFANTFLLVESRYPHHMAVSAFSSRGTIGANFEEAKNIWFRSEECGHLCRLVAELNRRHMNVNLQRVVSFFGACSKFPCCR